MVEQQDWIRDLLTEDEQKLPVGDKPIVEEAITKLSALIDEDGWQLLANTAATSMAEGVLQAAQGGGIPSIAA